MRLADNYVVAAGRALRIQPQRISVRAAADLQDAFAAAADQRAQALLVQPLPVALADMQRIWEFALAKGLPTVTYWEEFVAQGALLFYGPRAAEVYRRAGVYIDKILKGVKPADLPVEQATTFALVINLKTAKALRLTIPQSLLLRADRIIQ